MTKHLHYWRLVATSVSGATSRCRCGARKRDTAEGRIVIRNAAGEIIYQGRRPQPKGVANEMA